MKNIFLKSIFICLPLIAVLSSRCQRDPEEVVNHLRVSDSSIYFDETGPQTYTVTVDSDPAKWDHEIVGDWIEVSDVTANSFKITLSTNEEFQERSGKITVSNKFSDREIAINQSGKPRPGSAKVRLLLDYSSLALSKSGKIGAGLTYNGDLMLIDIATDQRTRLANAGEEQEIDAVSDDGKMIFVTPMIGGNSRYWADGRWNSVAPLPGESGGYVTDISADGSIWVGNSGKTPVKWTNGIPHQLDAPSENLSGTGIKYNAYALGCSADGTIIFGSMSSMGRDAFYWKADGSWEFIVPELHVMKTVTIADFFTGQPMEVNLFCNPSVNNRNSGISLNGRYLAVEYRNVVVTDMVPLTVQQPMIVDLETGEWWMLDESVDGYSFTASNDGVLFYGTPGTGTRESFVYDPSRGSPVSTSQWIKDNWGMNIFGDYGIYRIFDNHSMTGSKLAQTELGIIQIPWYVTTLGVE